MTAMLAIRLPEELEKRLARLAKRTGRTKTYYAREAIERHLEELEDIHLAQRRRAGAGARRSWSASLTWTIEWDERARKELRRFAKPCSTCIRR